MRIEQAREQFWKSYVAWYRAFNDDRLTVGQVALVLKRYSKAKQDLRKAATRK